MMMGVADLYEGVAVARETNMVLPPKSVVESQVTG